MERKLKERGKLPVHVLPHHIAEIIFRAHTILPGRVTRREYYADIIEAVRLTGYLNEPTKHNRAWYDYATATFLKRWMAGEGSFVKQDETFPEFRQGLDQMYKEHQRRLRDGRRAKDRRLANYPWAAELSELLNEIADVRWALCGPSRHIDLSKPQTLESPESQTKRS